MCRNVSPSVPGAHLQVRSFMFLDQQVMLTGFSGGTGREEKNKPKQQQKKETAGDETAQRQNAAPGPQVPAPRLQTRLREGLSSCLHPAPEPFSFSNGNPKSKSKLRSQLSLCIPRT